MRTRISIAVLTAALAVTACSSPQEGVPGGVDANRSSLAASPDTAVANGTSAVTLLATARDANGTVLAGKVATFAVSGTGHELSASTAATDAAGEASVTLTSTRAEEKTVSVTIGGVAVTQQATVTFTPGQAARLVFTVEPSGGAAGSLFTPPVEVAVEDAFGNPVISGSESVSLSLQGGTSGARLSGGGPASTALGVATFAALSIDKAGTGYALLASATGPTGATSSAFSVVAAAPDAAMSDLVADPTSLAAGGTSALTATVRDAFGNPVSGATVTFEATGTGNTISAPAVTDAAGVATGTLSSTMAEAKTVTAKVGTLSLADRPVVTFTAGAPDAAGSSLVASPTSVRDDGTQIALTATVGDRYGNPVAGETVTFSSSGAADFLQPGSATADDGTATGAVSALVAGAQTIFAHVGTVLVAQLDVTFTAAPPAEAISTVAVEPASVPADGTTAATATVTVNDVLGRPVAGATVVLSFSATATIEPASATTGADGVATFTLTSSTPGTGGLTAMVGFGTGEVVVAESPTLRFTATSFSIGGYVFGLHTDGLVLATSGQPDLAVQAGAKAFAFVSKVPSGTAYAVTVKTQPNGQTCTILDGSGTVPSRDAIGAVVDCARTWKQVAAGTMLTVALTSDGSLYTWGSDVGGTLGDGGSWGQVNFPVLIGSGFASVSAGSPHALAIKTDGSLYAWGYNSHGQLGDGTTLTRNAPVLVGTDFASASAGYGHTVAVKTDGSLYAWGQNSSGQLGDGSNVDRNAPVFIGSGFASASAGDGYTVAVKTDGSLHAWGSNAYGQLGDGSQTNRNVPVFIGSGFASAAAGYDHTVAIKTDGSLYAWGSGTWGELGNGTRSASLTPVFVGSGFASASNAFLHTVAVKTDGSLYAWGSGPFGELGDGSRAAIRTTPVLIGSGFASASTAWNHTVAIKLDGSLHSWGHSERGELGNGSQSSWGYPVLVGSDVAFVAAGNRHALAVKPDSSLHAWGYNQSGQLGDGTTTERHAPVDVGSGFALVDGGWDYTVAVRTDGSLWGWGSNNSGQLGDGSLLQRNTPVLIGSGFASVSAGSWHTVALKTDGSLYTWGSNNFGELGDGSTSKRSTTPVLIGSGFVSASAGAWHTVAVTTDGSLYAWGMNNRGQLGDGSLLQRNTPVLIGSGFASVSAGDSHTVALKTDGSLWAWGEGYLLGDGSATDSTVPRLIGTGFASIAVGPQQTVAVKTDGSLYAWGCAGLGQLCSGVPILVGSGFASAAAGGLYNVALRLDGSVWAWGQDDRGQLGDGFGDVLTPQPVPGVPRVFGLVYAANPVTYGRGVAITPDVPTSAGGPITSYSVSPALPDGLFLDAATGILSGRPAVTSPLTSYVVTGTGPTGRTTALLTIEVN